MKKRMSFVVLVCLASVGSTGCSNSNHDALARAQIDAATANSELIKAKVEAQVAKSELARANAELDRLQGRKPVSDEPTLEQRLLSLKANYDQSAITSSEWAQLKAQVIEQFPSYASATETRSLGQRMIDLKQAYEKGAVMSGEWTQAKNKLIAQAVSTTVSTHSLDRELGDLKKAYDSGAIMSDEWVRAKAAVGKIGK